MHIVSFLDESHDIFRMEGTYGKRQFDEESTEHAKKKLKIEVHNFAPSQKFSSASSSSDIDGKNCAKN